MPMNYKAFLINIQQKNTLFIVFLIAFFFDILPAFATMNVNSNKYNQLLQKAVFENTLRRALT